MMVTKSAPSMAMVRVSVSAAWVARAWLRAGRSFGERVEAVIAHFPAASGKAKLTSTGTVDCRFISAAKTSPTSMPMASQAMGTGARMGTTTNW